MGKGGRTPLAERGRYREFLPILGVWQARRAPFGLVLASYALLFSCTGETD